MLLDRIEIDAHGPLQDVQLGPLAEHLNVVCGPPGSGKTAIARFIRDSLVDRDYPQGMLSSSTGRIVWADRNGMVHCRREQDGSRQGRRTVEFEPRGDFDQQFGSLRQSWLSGVGTSTDASRALQSLELPESIVDGVITDTAMISVARIVSACVRSGLDSSDRYRVLPLHLEATYHDRDGYLETDEYGKNHCNHDRRLREELASTDAELARFGNLSADHEALVARRNRLTARLAHVPAETRGRTSSSGRGWRQELTRLHDRARQLRARQTELRRSIADIDRDIARCDTHHTTHHHDRYAWGRQRSSSIAELDRVTAELDACLEKAAEVRRSMRSVPIGESASALDDIDRHEWIDREAVRAEIRRIDHRLAALSRFQWLRARRSRLWEQLGVTRPVDTRSPLADVASRWLLRLSAGRLSRIDWARNRFAADANSYHPRSYHPRSSHHGTRQRTGVTINGRDESDCSSADRALAVLAIRLAAGELLARTGQHVPLVIETHRQLVCSSDWDNSPLGSLAYYERSDDLRSNHPFAAALRDYSRAGRQLIVLTSDQELSVQLSRAGARSFRIRGERIVHPHRPLWQSQYDAEQYVGPHPHTYGYRGADEVIDSNGGVAPIHSSVPPLHYSGESGNRSDESDDAMRQSQTKAVVGDINRDFDTAWREAYGYYDNVDIDKLDRPLRPSVGCDSDRTDWACDGAAYRDGYYYADAYTTKTRPQIVDGYSARGDGFPSAAPAGNNGHARQRSGLSSIIERQSSKPASPFFLSVDSPIDQAPSIDAVAAARLRGLNVTHVNHLMQQDSNRLADALGLASVDAATVRRWQAECRLVCRVPQLRGFDARVLVGCGVTTPAQLAAIHPADLLQEVEDFLATERGQQILLSGSSHELSRITSWIAAGNSSSGGDMVLFGHGRENLAATGSRRRSYYRGSGRRVSGGENHERGDSTEYDREPSYSHRVGRRRRRVIGGASEQERVNREDVENSQGSSRNRRSRLLRSKKSDGRAEGQRRRRPGSRGKQGSQPTDEGNRGVPRSHRGNRVGDGHANVGRPGRKTRSTRDDRDVVRYERHEQRPRPATDESSEEELRFYLDRQSPVVDAPSIGARMAERLHAIGIETVDDLLNADPQAAAAELEHRRAGVDTIIDWQHQATLVCCVPMLRGHDAQLLVAAEVIAPDQLAACDAEELFTLIDPIARSSEGKRMLRGGKLPDIEEIKDWIGFAQHYRGLQAA